jgi:hypothetical protein
MVILTRWTILFTVNYSVEVLSPPTNEFDKAV